MTSYSTALNAGYGQGVYVASASNDVTWAAWRAFDKTVDTIWQVGTGLYTLNTPYSGAIKTVDISGNSYAGEWLQIQNPSSIVLSNYTIYGVSTNMPTIWYILGSRDGTSWSLVDQRNFNSWSGYSTFTVGSSTAFAYFRFVLNQSNGSQPAIYDWTLNGYIEGLTVAPDGELGVGVSNPVQALEVAGSAVVAGTVSSGSPFTFKNALYNGDVRIAQRGVSFVNPNSVYALDRWFISGYGSLGNETVSQVQSGLANFANAIQLQQTSTSLTNSWISQSLETRDVVRFKGQSVTLSFWYRIPTSFTRVWTARIAYNTSVDSRISDDGTTTLVSALVDLPNQSAWTYASLTGFIPATAQSLSVQFVTTNGIINGATFQLTGVQLEKGTVATPFEFRPFATELALCQRYYTRFDSAGATSNYTRFGAGVVDSTTGAYTLLQLPVVMRAVPAFPGNATSNSAPSTFVLSIGGSNFTVTSMSSGDRTSSVVGMTWTGTGGVARAGALAIANNTTTAYLAYDAEL
jgi:hypothetical protein